MSSYNNTYSETEDDEIFNFSNSEASFLFASAAVGLSLNLVVVVLILVRKNLRKMTSAYIAHCCVLDIIKCGYSIPFASSLLYNQAPRFCSVLGGSYVVIVTASTFNLIAMICCEVYIFTEHNVGSAGEGSLCCAAFGVAMVYVGSMIIHLGPSVIAGDFNYNELIGNCLITYGRTKSYVCHLIWISITTATIIAAFYYLRIFYKNVQDNSTHRVASLARMSFAISRGKVPNNTNVNQQILDSLSRVRCLIALIILFVLCWYPLFVLTLLDPRFEQPSQVYRILSFIAWSNAAVNPLIFLFFDRSISVVRQCCRKNSTDDEAPDALLMTSYSPCSPMLQPNQQVGSRLSDDGKEYICTDRMDTLGDNIHQGNRRPPPSPIQRHLCEIQTVSSI